MATNLSGDRIKPFRWTRLVCLGISIVLFVLVIQRVKWDSVKGGWASLEWQWAVAALSLFGLSCSLAAFRWRMMLKLTEVPCSRSQALRGVLVGHFFNGILLGPAGGDMAKSAVFSRWHGAPVSQLLAGSVMDRLAGGCGSLLFLIGAVGAAFATNNPLAKRDWDFDWAGPELALGFVCVPVAGWFGYRFLVKQGSFLQRFLKNLLGAFQKIRAQPKTMALGIGLAFLVQLFLHGVMILSLAAVSDAPIPWLQLLWVFPIISMLTSMPISIAGVGVREAGAMVLLGWYGVPAGEAVAASVLTLSANLFWAVVGACLLCAKEGVPFRRK